MKAHDINGRVIIDRIYCVQFILSSQPRCMLIYAVQEAEYWVINIVGIKGADEHTYQRENIRIPNPTDINSIEDTITEAIYGRWSRENITVLNLSEGE